MKLKVKAYKQIDESELEQLMDESPEEFRETDEVVVELNCKLEDVEYFIYITKEDRPFGLSVNLGGVEYTCYYDEQVHVMLDNHFNAN